VRILSGIQPSGKPHLGNYFAMMKRMVDYQKEGELFAFLANYHALTTVHDEKKLKTETIEAALDFLAIGIDPEKSTFWVQSDVPEVTELTWILSTVTSIGLLERAHSYKDKVSKGIIPNHGLFSYPVLMAADILAFGSNRVPVGKDQKQHLEMARDIAIRFNATFGETFIVPEEDILEDVATVPGIDGQKMSKSYGNYIELFADEETLRKKVMAIKTDSTPVDQPKPLEDNPLYEIYALFLNKAEKEELKERFLTPGLKYGEVKKELFNVIWEYFAPFRAKREYYAQDKGEILNILRKGKEKARIVASEFVSKARSNIGLNYWE